MPPPDDSNTRHEEIARDIRDELSAGHYGVEGRLPSEAQLVRRFGVSRPTAARALRTLVEEGLIERRAGSGTFAKLDRSQGADPSGGLLALLVPDLGNTEIFHLISGEIASLARVHHYNLVWGASSQPKLDGDQGLRHAEELCEQFVERRVSGVFFAPYELVPEKAETNQRLATLLHEAGIPVVLLDRDYLPFPMRSDHDLVGIDNFTGGYMLAEHLLKLGCRSFHFVTRPLSASTVDARIAGVREAMGRWNIEHERNWVRTGDISDKAFVRSLVAGKQADALICANDHTATLLMRTLKQISVTVPNDVRVVGFDDVKLSTMVFPPLTTILQPYREIAAAAFRAMADRQDNPSLPARQIMLKPRLVVRDSCGAYLPRSKQP